MIITILRTAHASDVRAAMRWTADNLHIPEGEVTELFAVAYVVRHFEQGDYSGWDGYVEMRAADQASIDRYRRSTR
jgi:hypothetical protein